MPYVIHDLVLPTAVASIDDIVKLDFSGRNCVYESVTLPPSSISFLCVQSFTKLSWRPYPAQYLNSLIWQSACVSQFCHNILSPRQGAFASRPTQV